MTLSININLGASANGGVGVGVMTSAGNPWSVPDAVAQELVNRGVASAVNWLAAGPLNLTAAQVAALAAANPLGSTTPVALWTDSTAVALRGPAGQTVAVGGGGGGSPGGSTTQFQFNNAGAFGGAVDVNYQAPGKISLGSANVFGRIEFLGSSTNPFRIDQLSAINPGGNPKKDDVFCFGYNVDAATIRRNTADHAFGMWIEAAYGPTNGAEQVEWYLQGITAGGLQSRPIAVNFNRSTGDVVAQFNANNVYFYDSQGGSGAVSLTFITDGIIKTGVNGLGKLTITAADVDGGMYYTLGAVGGFTIDSRAHTNGSIGITLLAPASQAYNLLDIQVGGASVVKIGSTGNLSWRPAASATPANNTDLTFERTANNMLTLKLKGTDGTVRSIALSLL